MTNAYQLFCDRCGFASERDSNVGYNKDQERLWTDISSLNFVGKVRDPFGQPVNVFVLSHLCPGCTRQLEQFMRREEITR
jgi:C4-type Zn-finger protein